MKRFGVTTHHPRPVGNAVDSGWLPQARAGHSFLKADSVRNSAAE
jgi:hypothetical protein